jgi:hypothetical protein
LNFKGMHIRKCPERNALGGQKAEAESQMGLWGWYFS